MGKQKYRAVRVDGANYLQEMRGHHFDSKFEASVACDLCVRQRIGEISDLKFQHTVRLSAAQITWRIDFSYREDGKLIYHEAKGVETESYKLKLKLFKAYGDGILRITKGRASNKQTQEIIPREGMKH